ncbi:MAG: nitrate reductase molybdenum cofactor assembly chaperone [Thiobacillaceae bacterium]|jgi:nitrate reductase molybdenum cofactor assembly chaperone NarJ/NarW|nr:nitrate reductase molybdenum cofactor assembly chaperone [Hydrogenophilales bacterium]MBP8901017.1 nitrate reductase molybdenum cofactor assembly chaperone [Thiobacillaceae bacterium]MBP9915131.1 nitrate reductase molybdenum cofactor assembly chaperone [Thiobacillaceae bacterium]
MFYPLLSKLLDYPSTELMQALPELRASLRQGFEATEWIVLDRFMKEMSEQDLTEAQAAYVQTFDLTPEHALHLTHHLFGDDKNRGPALIDLTEFYKEYGLELVVGESAANDRSADEDHVNELPDFLPLVLEFAGQLEAEEGRLFLSQWSKVLNQLASNLEKAKSIYAPLIRLVEQRSLLVKAAA